MNDTINLPSEGLVLNPESIADAKEWEELISLWTTSQEIDKKNQWYKGDIADRVAVVYGEASLKQFAEEVKESHVTLGHYRRVSRAFPKAEMRNWNLSWTYYFMASLSDSFNKGSKQFDTDNRFKWLEEAHDNGWTTSRLEAEIKKSNAIKQKSDYFDYYDDRMTKFRNMIIHLEKHELTDEEKSKLVQHLLYIYNEFKEYIEKE